MKKIGILVTSTSSIDYLNIEKENLKVVRLKIIIDEKEYTDFTELKAENFFDKISKDDKIVPRTSTPNYSEYMNCIKQFEEEGYQEVLIITISSKMSNSYSVAYSVANEYQGDLVLKTYDSYSASIQEGLFGIKALEMLKDGKNTDEIIQTLDEMKKNNKMYIMVTSLRLLIKNGRLSTAKGFIGKMLKIKPILVVEEGEVKEFGKVRTVKKGIENILNEIKKEVENFSDYLLTIAHCGDLDMIESIKIEINKFFPNKDIIETPITPVIGCHTAEKAIGIGYCKK